MVACLVKSYFQMPLLALKVCLLIDLDSSHLTPHSMVSQGMKMLYEKESFLHWLVLDHVLGSHQIGLAFLSKIICQVVESLIVAEINFVAINSLKDSDCFFIDLKRFHKLSQAFNTHSSLVYLVVALCLAIM